MQSNIDDVKTYLRDDEGSAVRVERSDIPSLREYTHPSALPESAKGLVHDSVQHGVFLNPKRGAFGDDPKDWSFFKGDDIITATIRDKGFLARYANGEYRLNQSDLLTVDLLVRQKVKGTQVQKKPIYEILKVTHYEKGSTQPPLPFS